MFLYIASFNLLLDSLSIKAFLAVCKAEICKATFYYCSFLCWQLIMYEVW